MKLYHLALGAAFLGGIAYGCSHKKESHDTLTDLKVSTIEAGRTITDAFYPDNLGSALESASNDMRYANPGRAANNLTRIDPSISSQPLQSHRREASLKRDGHNIAKDVDQGLKILDLNVEKILHKTYQTIEDLF